MHGLLKRVRNRNKTQDWKSKYYSQTLGFLTQMQL